MDHRLTCLALASVLLVGCASSKPETDAPAGRSDPFEGFNRTMFNFNYNVLDPYVVRPVAVAWRDYVPVPARAGLSNFLGNLSEPASMVNAILVGEPRNAGIHFTRFFLNTVLGLGGFIDVAGKANPELARQGRNASVPRWGTMAWATVLTCSCLAMAALRCVRTAAIMWIRFIRCWAG